MANSTTELLRQQASVIFGWYVMVQSGRRRGPLYGPFHDEQDANSWVDPVRKEAEKIDSWAWAYDWGVARLERPAGKPLPEGRLNKRMAGHVSEPGHASRA